MIERRDPTHILLVEVPLAVPDDKTAQEYDVVHEALVSVLSVSRVAAMGHLADTPTVHLVPVTGRQRMTEHDIKDWAEQNGITLEGFQLGLLHYLLDREFDRGAFAAANGQYEQAPGHDHVMRPVGMMDPPDHMECSVPGCNYIEPIKPSPMQGTP